MFIRQQSDYPDAISSKTEILDCNNNDDDDVILPDNNVQAQTTTLDNAAISQLAAHLLLKANTNSGAAQSIGNVSEVVIKSDPAAQAKHERSVSPLRRGESGIAITRHLPFGRVTSEKMDVTKNTTLASQSIFSPITNRVCNYASLYNLLIVSDVVSTQNIASYPSIPKAEMMPDNIDNIDDDAIFQIGFARKDCSYTPITHASLAFRNRETGKFLIVGRQNQQFLKANANESDSSFAWWAVSNAVNPLTLYRFTTTKMDNEKKYNFFPGTPFNAEITDAFMTGAEIKNLIRDVNQNICIDQRYDVVHSNCYSAVSYGLAKAFEMIANKPLADNFDDQEAAEASIRKNKELKRLFTLICHALQDNYKMGSGSINNTVVNDAIQNTINILHERKLLNIIDKAITPPSSANALLEYSGFITAK